jgi:hypothetical protein
MKELLLVAIIVMSGNTKIGGQKQEVIKKKSQNVCEIPKTEKKSKLCKKRGR